VPIDPWRPLNPYAGDHFWRIERRFRYLVIEDAVLREKWAPRVLACPVCGAEHGLCLAFQEHRDVMVQARCHRRHTWPEPRIDRRHFTAWSRLRTGTGEEDRQWLVDAGFGEEPPEPIDYVRQLKEGWGYGAKYLARKARSRAKAEIRRPVRNAKDKARKRVRTEAARPVAAALRTAWTWQTKGAGPAEAPRPKNPKKKKPAPKVPPVSAYRRAYGMEPPERGPDCLVCEDTRRLTALGISIPCPECKEEKEEEEKD
jgi:hypothetical protein